jgi:hypothetical protein
MKRRTIIVIAGILVGTGYFIMSRDRSLGVAALTATIKTTVQKGAQASGAAYTAVSSSIQKDAGSFSLPAFKPAAVGEDAKAVKARFNEYVRQYLAILVRKTQELAAAIDKLLEEEKRKALESAKKPLVDAYVGVATKVGSSLGAPVVVQGGGGGGRGGSSPGAPAGSGSAPAPVLSPASPSPSSSQAPSSAESGSSPLPSPDGPSLPVPSIPPVTEPDIAGVPFAYRITAGAPASFSFAPMLAGGGEGTFDVRVSWGDGTVFVRRDETKVPSLVFSHTWEKEGRYTIMCAITWEDGTVRTYEAAVDVAP